MTETIMVSWLISSFLEGCIDPYYPDINDNQQSIIIYGTLTNKEGYHYIFVSRSVRYEYHYNIPVRGCSVEVIDDENNSIQFYESEPGLYEQWIDQEYLKTGKKYKLRVITGGSVYESRYETMLLCPPVGNVYYEIEKRETSDPENDIHGIQFYTDLVAPVGYPKNYRWELEETWEYHAEYLVRAVWDRYVFREGGFYGTDSVFFCWSTDYIHEIHAATLEHTTGDSLSMIPLNYVSNETNRLKVKYSLLVKQYSLSDSAYYYWNQLKQQNEETGGLYETQPAQIRGNISNMNDDNELVLGFFNVSGLTEKRIFVSEGFDFFPMDYCKLTEPIAIPDLRRYYWGRTVFLIEVARRRYVTAPNECFDCTVRGGTVEKPDFWE